MINNGCDHWLICFPQENSCTGVNILFLSEELNKRWYRWRFSYITWNTQCLLLGTVRSIHKKIHTIQCWETLSFSWKGISASGTIENIETSVNEDFFTYCEYQVSSVFEFVWAFWKNAEASNMIPFLGCFLCDKSNP